MTLAVAVRTRLPDVGSTERDWACMTLNQGSHLAAQAEVASWPDIYLADAPVYPALAGAGVLSATALSGTHLRDDFNRADSATSIGANWTNRYGTMGINGNAAYGLPNGGAWVQASYNSPVTADDMSVGYTVGGNVGTGGDYLMLALGANTAGECVLGYFHDGNQIAVSFETGWGLIGFGTAASGTMAYAPGDFLEVRRSGAAASIYKNGVYSGLTGNVPTIPRDSSHRLCGACAYSPSAGNFRRMDAWQADSA